MKLLVGIAAILFTAWYASLVEADNPTEELSRAAHWQAVLEDEDYIVALHKQNLNAMRAKATRSGERLGPERYDKIMKLIDSAEEAADLSEWYEQKRLACEGGT